MVGGPKVGLVYKGNILQFLNINITSNIVEYFLYTNPTSGSLTVT